MKKIYKVLPRSEWVNAIASGVFYGSEIDLKDGYIHFSTAEQVEKTVEKHFSDQKDLLLVTFDADELGESLYWEVSRDGDLFPHLYADIGVSMALDVQPLEDLANGTHKFPEAY